MKMRVSAATPSVARSWLLGAETSMLGDVGRSAAGIDVAELVQQGW